MCRFRWHLYVYGAVCLSYGKPLISIKKAAGSCRASGRAVEIVFFMDILILFVPFDPGSGGGAFRCAAMPGLPGYSMPRSESILMK